MTLTYQTGIATLIQLGVMTLLNVLNGFHSVGKQCTNGSTNCVETIILSLLYFMVITLWFGFLWILGAAAQDRRSKRMAQLLFMAEFMVFVVAAFNAQHHNHLLGLITSLTDAVLAAWIMLLAFRLIRSGGARVTTSGRARRRRLAKH